MRRRHQFWNYVDVVGRFIRRCLETFVYCWLFTYVAVGAIRFMNYIGVKAESEAHIDFTSGYYRFIYLFYVAIFVIVFKYR